MELITNTPADATDVALTWCYPFGEKLQVQAKMIDEKIVELEIKIPSPIIKRRISMSEIITKDTFQFNSQPTDLHEIWYQIGQSLLLSHAYNLPISAVTIWHKIVIELWRFYTENFFMATLYYNLCVRQLLMDTMHFHQQLRQFLNNQSEILSIQSQIQGLDEYCFLPAFENLLTMLPDLNRIAHQHCDFIFYRREFVDQCLRIKLPSPAQLSESTLALPAVSFDNIWDLFKNKSQRILYCLQKIRLLIDQLVYASQAIPASAPSSIPKQKITISIETPWGFMPATLSPSRHGGTMIFYIQIIHPEIEVRRDLQRLALGKTLEELAILIAALSILPDGGSQ